MTGLVCADVSRLAGGGQCRRCQGRPLYSLFIGCEDRENSHNSQVRAAYAMWLPRMLDLWGSLPGRGSLVCGSRLHCEIVARLHCASGAQRVLSRLSTLQAWVYNVEF